MIIKRDFASKQQFLISSRLQNFSAYESFGGDAGMLNLVSLGNNQFAFNLSKFDEFGDFSQLKFMPFEVMSNGFIDAFGASVSSSDSYFGKLFDLSDNLAGDTGNLYPASSEYSNDNAELAQGFKVTV